MKQAMDSMFAKKMLLLGPDIYGLTRRGGAATTYLTEFMAAKPPLDIVTIHLYPLMDSRNLSTESFYDESRLDISRQSATAARSIVDAAPGAIPHKRTPLWVGEGSPSWRVVCSHGCGALGQNLTFELAYLDMLGSFAASGVELFARQCLNSVVNPETDSSGGVTPGFWTAVLFKRLMGTAVLNATVAKGNGVRVYAHRTPLGGAITVMLLNLNPTETLVRPILFQAAACTSAETAHRYTLQAGPNLRNCSSWGDCGAAVLLNGKLLSFSSKDSAVLPEMDGVVSSCNRVTLPPHSVTWLVVPNRTDYALKPMKTDDAVDVTKTLKFESVATVGSRWSATDCHNGDCRYDPTWTIAFDPVHILVQANLSTFRSTNGGLSFSRVSQQWHHGLGNPSVPEPPDGDLLCSFMTADFGYAGVDIPHPHTKFTSPSGHQWCVNLTSQRFSNKSLTTGKYSQAVYTGLPYRTAQFPVNAGGITRLADGSFVSIVPVWFVPTTANNTFPVPPGPCCNGSVVAFRSDDAKNWSFTAFVAQKVDMDWPSEEGPSECSLTLLKDNRTLFVVMRTDGGDSQPHHYHRSYASSLSTSFGHSWSRAKLLPSGMGAAFPRATTLADGTIVVSGGRSPPGPLAAGPLNVWASFDGFGKNWDAFGIPAAHNRLIVDKTQRFCEAYVHADSNTGWEESSCYTSLNSLGVDSSTGRPVALVCYERQGSGSGGYVHNIQPKACQHDHSTVYCMRVSVKSLKTDDPAAGPSSPVVRWGLAPAAVKLQASWSASAASSGSKKTTVDIAGQRGECEHVQLWLRCSSAELVNVSVSFDSMATVVVGGPHLPASAWAYRQQAFVFNNCSAHASHDAWNPCHEGWLPDPLLPPVPGVGVPRVPHNFTQPLFLDLCIPQGMAPGNYSCAKCITVHGFAGGSAFSFQLGAAVEVWPISMPELNSSTAFSTVFSLGEGGQTDDTTSQPLGGGGLNNFYPTYFEHGSKMRQQWYSSLASHRVPADDLYLMRYRSLEEYQLLADSGAKWMNVGYAKCCPVNSSGCVGVYAAHFCTNKTVQSVIEYLRPIVGNLTELGLIDRAYLYGWDEFPRKFMSAIYTLFGAVKKEYPRLRLVGTLASHYKGEYDSLPLDLPLDIWVQAYDWCVQL
jgi:hypothetical protein